MKDIPYQVTTHEEKDGRKVTVVVKKYANKLFRGVSKCLPSDPFSTYLGELLASLRCTTKVLKAREKNAFKKYYDAVVATEKAEKREANLLKFYNRTVRELRDAQEDLEGLEAYMHRED